MVVRMLIIVRGELSLVMRGEICLFRVKLVRFWEGRVLLGVLVIFVCYRVRVR